MRPSRSQRNRTIVLFCRKDGGRRWRRGDLIVRICSAFGRAAADEDRGRRPRRRRRPDRGAPGPRRPRGLGARARRDAGARPRRRPAGRERARLVLGARSRRATMPRRSGAQELVVIAVKAPALPARRRARSRRCSARRRSLLPAMNGVPWWFLPAAVPDAGAARERRPGRPPARAAAARARPRLRRPPRRLEPGAGRVRHDVGERLIVGEPAGGASARVDAVCAALASAGFQAEASADVRRDVWYKLWGNMTMNPVSALTGALTDAILDDALVRDFVLRCMAEAAAIGARIGCPIAQSGEERLDLTRELGGFRTSMLQDADAGRPIELDALVTAVHEIGGRVGVADAEHRRAARPDPADGARSRPLPVVTPLCRHATARHRPASRRRIAVLSGHAPCITLGGHGSPAARHVRPPAGLDLGQGSGRDLRQRRRRLDARRRLPRAARRHAAAHRPAVADRGASDHRRARRGAEPRLAALAGAQQPEAVRARPPGLRLLRRPLPRSTT